MTEFDIDTMPLTAFALSQGDEWDMFSTSTLLTVKTTLGVVHGSMAVINAINRGPSTFNLGEITCGCPAILLSVGAAPGAQTVRTAAQMMADIPGAVPGCGYWFRIINTAGTLTVTQDSGATVTLIGTMTVAANTFRDFLLYFMTPTTATIRSIGAGTT